MMLTGGVARSVVETAMSTSRKNLCDHKKLGHILHTFRAGSQIRIDITSSNSSRRAFNTNSASPTLAHDIRIATNTIYHAEDTPSFIEFFAFPSG